MKNGLNFCDEPITSLVGSLGVRKLGEPHVEMALNFKRLLDDMKLCKNQHHLHNSR